ncbi:hypothetical protein [Paracoccus sp. (in: a-proteobacteria)]|uniref:hypothetical protein n=1 Tax=Paracoccus sp. TaxID=267 RepID=UPI0027295B7D|nr:hypothetical protein [Paracoccus sp. (in: a-proteobacteria)]
MFEDQPLRVVIASDDIAAVAGTVINRLQFGGLSEFSPPVRPDLAFHAELPAFMLLGLS